jgi:hypothetical protein
MYHAWNLVVVIAVLFAFCTANHAEALVRVGMYRCAGLAVNATGGNDPCRSPLRHHANGDSVFLPISKPRLKLYSGGNILLYSGGKLLCYAC